MGDPEDTTWKPLPLEEYDDVHKQDVFGRSALTIASTLNLLDIVETQLENGADVNLGLPLHHACWRGNVEIVKKLLEKSPDVNVRDPIGRPPIILAVMESHKYKENGHIIEILEALVEYGADINDTDATKSTPLHLAAGNCNLPVMKAIVRLGGDVTRESKFHHTPLHDNILSLQADEEQIKFLLENGANFTNKNDIATEICFNSEMLLKLLKHLPDEVHKRNVDNETCLQQVVKCKWLDRLLTEAEAEGLTSLVESMDVNNAAIDGSTALHDAVTNEDLAAVKWLLDHDANVNVVTYNNTLPFHIALSKNNVEITKALLEKGSYINVNILNITFNDVYCDKEFVKDKALQPHKLSDEIKALMLEITEVQDSPELLGWTPLHHAVYAKDADKVLSLLDDSIDVNTEDNFKRTALSLAAMENSIELLKILLDNGADVDCGNALLYAARRGHAEVALELVQRGANLELTDRFRRTALHLAIFFDFPNIVEILLQNDIDVNSIKDDCEELPLHVACNTGNVSIVKLLLEKNADVNAQCMHEDIPLTLTKNVEILRMLLDAEANIDAVNDDKESSLHRAAAEEEIECVKELVSRGCNINLQNTNGQTALHLAAENPEIVQILLENGANPNLHSIEGFTALHAASFEGNLECVKLLLAHNADVNFPSLDYILPIYLAISKGHKDVVKELLDANSRTDIPLEDLSMIPTEYKFQRYNLISGYLPIDCADEEMKAFLQEYASSKS